MTVANDPKVACPSDDAKIQFTETVEPSAGQVDETLLLETDEPLESLESFLETQKKLLHKANSEEAGSKSSTSEPLAQTTAMDSTSPKQPEKKREWAPIRKVSVDGLRALSHLNSNTVYVDAERLVDSDHNSVLSDSDDSDGPPLDCESDGYGV